MWCQEENLFLISVQYLLQDKEKTRKSEKIIEKNGKNANKHISKNPKSWHLLYTEHSVTALRFLHSSKHNPNNNSACFLKFKWIFAIPFTTWCLSLAGSLFGCFDSSQVSDVIIKQIIKTVYVWFIESVMQECFLGFYSR